MAYFYGTCDTGASATGKYECRLSYSYTQQQELNQSTITVSLQARANNSAYSTTADFYRTVHIEQTHGTFTVGGDTSWKTLKTETWTVTHDDNGELTYHIAGAFYQNNVGGAYALYSGSAEGYIEFTPIPRYATINSFSATINSPTSMACSWSTDKSCSAVYYSINNGSTWSSSVGSGTSGSFNITGLTANTTYPIKLKVTASDSGLDTISSAFSRTTWALSTSSFANFNLGTDVTATITRASTTMSHDIVVYAKSPTSGSYTLIKTYSGITGTTQTISFTSGELDTIYNLIPNSTYADIRLTTTTKIGSTSYGTTNSSVQNATIVNDTNSQPLFTTFTYADVSATTLALTGNSQTLIKGYSNVTATITTTNKAVAQKGATMASYSLIIGGSTTSVAYSGVATVTATVNAVTNSTMIVRAIDSRGYYREVPIVATTWHEYTSPTISTATATRTDDIEEETTLSYNGTFYNYNFGSVTNSISTTYAYKITSDSSYTNGTTALTPTASGQTYSDTMLIAGDDGANGFLQVNSYNIKIVVSDSLSSVTYYALLNAGKPNLAIHQDGVAINQAYDEVVGGALQVNGDVIVNSVNLFKLIYPVGSIYMSVSSTNPSTLFGGTWVAWGTGRVPIGINASDADFNTVEETGGSKTYSLPAHTHTGPAHTHTSAAHTHGLGSGYAMIMIGAKNVYYREKASTGFTANWALTGITASASASSTYTPGESTTLGGNSDSTTPGSTGSSGTGNTGSDGDATINIVQPYITCYMWKRTA